MSGRRAFALLALVALPSLAAAQRSKAASGRDKTLMAEDGSKERRAEITARDLEEQSPLRLLVDKRKDLKLSDEQLGKLKDLESKLKEKNGPLLRIVDSVNREMRPPRGEVTDEYRTKMRNLRNELMGTVEDIHRNYAAAAREGVLALDAEQQNKAVDLLDKQKADIEKKMNEKSGRGERP
jgi:hypothetical protein